MGKEKMSTILSLWYYLCQNTGNTEIALSKGWFIQNLQNKTPMISLKILRIDIKNTKIAIK